MLVVLHEAWRAAGFLSKRTWRNPGDNRFPQWAAPTAQPAPFAGPLETERESSAAERGGLEWGP